MNYDAREFGAVGDGVTNDTAAIQNAIDVCSSQGGGVVVLRNGTFFTGTIHLKSHVNLRLTSTAVLLGSTDSADYYVDAQTPYKQIEGSLIYASGCDHIAVTGEGTIDCQGGSFAAGPYDKRPVGVRFRDCTNVIMKGVLLKDAASFMFHPIHCRQMRIDGIRIDSVVQPNNDGIDLDGCKDVFICNCNIRSSDDSIALKVLEPGRPCTDIVVTNCILSSICAAIRIGPDAMENIERVTVSNCVIRDTVLNGIKIQESMGAVMRDFTFSNIVMDNVAGPISLRLAGWEFGDTNEWAVFSDETWEQGELRNVLFSNIRGVGMAAGPKLGISITGAGKARPRAISFSDIDITFPGGGTAEEGERRNVPDMERAYPECMIFGVLPGYGLYTHHVDALTLNNVRFSVASEEQRPAIVCDDIRELEITGFKAESNGAASLIRLERAEDAWISSTRVVGNAESLVRVEGAESDRIALVNCEARGVKSLVATSDDVAAGAVTEK